jgi:hypothetical protein
MSCFKLMGRNLVDNASITPSDENALFPAINIFDNRRSKVYRSLTSSSDIIFDLQETQEINHVFIVASKRDGFGISTAKIQFNATASFVSPASEFDITFTNAFGFAYVEIPLQEYRFARLVMTSSLDYTEISNVYIGKALPLERTINFNWSIKNDELSNKQFNRYGQMFTDIIDRQKTISFSISNMDKVDLALINSILDVYGETSPVYIIIGDATIVDDNRRFSGPVIINDSPTISNPRFNKYNLSLSVKELM